MLLSPETLRAMLPKFIQNNVWARINPEQCENCTAKPCICRPNDDYKQVDPLFVGQKGINKEAPTTLEDCNVLTSRTHSSYRLERTGKGSMSTQKPVLDIDFPCALIPSTTEGHFHLYLDKELSYTDYMKLLKVLSEVGIIEEGYYKASKARGYTAVRLPWIKKEKINE